MPPALKNVATTNVPRERPDGPNASAPDKVFSLSLDDANVPLVLTRKAQLEFELQGLEAMDECLITLCEHLTPANAPDLRPRPLNLVGQMMIDGAHSGNMRKLMLCALWIGHHYPSIRGLTAHGETHGFVTHD